MNNNLRLCIILVFSSLLFCSCLAESTSERDSQNASSSNALAYSSSASADISLLLKEMPVVSMRADWSCFRTSCSVGWVSAPDTLSLSPAFNASDSSYSTNLRDTVTNQAGSTSLILYPVPQDSQAMISIWLLDGTIVTAKSKGEYPIGALFQREKTVFTSLVPTYVIISVQSQNRKKDYLLGVGVP